MRNAPRKSLPNGAATGASALRGLVTFLVTVSIAAAAVFWGPELFDKVLAANYEPSPRIEAVNERIKLTPRGTELFYASSPSIDGKEEFNQRCQSTERTTAMLGCYFQRKIYLYDVQNPELDGAIEVTAAHEMLHAAYDRLNLFERQRVDAMIETEYENVRHNPEIEALMQYYREAEPGEELNELHSMIGTMTDDISPELESYYQKYFTDRDHIVELNTRYSEVFRQVEARANELAAAIKAEAATLEADLASYDADRTQLELDIQSFNRRAASGGFTSQSAFNTTREALTRRSDGLNARRVNINHRVATYNQNVEQLNALSVKVRELNQSINGAEEAPAGL